MKTKQQTAKKLATPKALAPGIVGTFVQHKSEMQGKTVLIGTKALPVAHVVLSKGVRPLSTFTVEGDDGICGVLFIPSAP